MVSLKNPDGQIPNGLRWTQAETGWDSTKMLGTYPSMASLTRAVIAHRQGNPWLVSKHQWSTDYDEVLKEMRDYNAQICLAHGWTKFINTDEQPPPQVKKKLLSLLAGSPSVAGARNIAAGVGVLLDWLGDGGKAVEPALSEKRAAICAGCEKNGKGGITSYFTKPIAEKIRQQLEIRDDLQLRTSFDDKLGVCESCMCPLKLKSHVPLDFILEHTSDETMAAFVDGCWIKRRDQ